MKRFRTPAAAIAVWLLSAVAAQAQGPVYTPPSRPSFSPYLNLLRGDSSTTLNYFGLVRPEQQIRRNQAALAQEIRQTNQSLDDTIKGADPNLPATGHAASFNNTMGYFGGGGGSGSRNFSRPMVFGGNRPQVMGSQRPQPFQGGGIRR